ncbi:MAG: hypothetical protein ACYC5M_16470 [Anaerolineae bacterium]
MRIIALGLKVVLLASLLSGCSPASSSKAQPLPAETAPPQGTATTLEATASSESTSGDAAKVAGEQPTETFREALTAREAFVAADEAAKVCNTEYELYEVLGCHKAAPYGQFERDSHLVEGTCAQWLFYYVRPVSADSAKGYHALFIRVGPNGVLETEEQAHEDQVRKRAQGDLSGWQVDSDQAIAIAEREGGSAYRAANPEWDTGRFEADRNAVLIATLEFSPYWDSASGKDYAGSTGVVWIVKYPPLNALEFVIDAFTGEVLLKKAD